MNFLISTEPHHQRCRAFIQHLARHDATEIYVSSLVWLEYAHTVTRESFRNQLQPAIRQRFQLDQWPDAGIRESYLRAMLADFEALLSQIGWTEIFLDDAVRTEAINLMLRYNLGSQDAIHLASAVSVGLRDFASLHRRFRRVDDLNLWDDLIYAGQPA